MTITYVESSKLPTPWGIFVMHGFCDEENFKEHVVLTMGDISGDEPLLARIHSECLTGDALWERGMVRGVERGGREGARGDGRGASAREEARGARVVLLRACSCRASFPRECAAGAARACPDPERSEGEEGISSPPLVVISARRNIARLGFERLDLRPSRCQITPRGIHLRDQVQLLRARPSLDLPLAFQRRAPIRGDLEVHEAIAVIQRREAVLAW